MQLSLQQGLEGLKLLCSVIFIFFLKKAISFMSRDSLFSGHSSGLREVPFL